MAQNSSREPIVMQRVRPREAGRLTLSSEAFGVDGRMGEAYSGYHDDLSPPLMWTGAPEADTYALIVEDSDALGDKPELHWAVWNIPGALQGLPAGLPKEPVLEEYDGLTQGLNYRGAFGYRGPRPPLGGPHRYHFQLFALDSRLELLPTAPLEALVTLLKASAIAAFDLVGSYEEPDRPSPPCEPEARSFSPPNSSDDRGEPEPGDNDGHAPRGAQDGARPDYQG